MPQRELQRQTRRLSLAVTVSGVVLAVATLAAAAFFARFEFKEALREDTEQGEVQARVLVDHATRSVDSTSVVLTYIASQLRNAQIAVLPQRADTALAPALAALPFVRGLAVVDAGGWILGSTQESEVGQQSAILKGMTLPAPDAEVLGNFVAGRSLIAMASVASARPGVGFIPLVHAVAAQGGQPLYLVALLNPDSFSTFQVLTLNDPHSSAYLLSYGGQILASSGTQALHPGADASQHAIFKRYLPNTEYAVFVDDGISPDRQITAYRVSRTRPLVAVVEQRYADTVQRWFESMRWFAAAAALVVAFILALTWLMHRALSARLRAQSQLERARQNVVDRERDLRILVSSVQELIFRTDVNGRISYVNERWSALSGQSADQALGQSLAKLVEPEDISRLAALFHADPTIGVRHALVGIRSLDGVLHKLDITVVALHGGGRIAGFAGSAVDVTERDAAQLALEHQLDFVALLLEISPLPVATCDAKGRYVTVNRAWEEFMGFTREHVVGSTYGDVMPAADAEEQMRQDAELWQSGKSLRFETLLNHRDGSRRNVVITKTLVNGDDYHPSSVLSTMMDVSEFREAERATQLARDAAEESSRAKSEFIANISHELRTPLQSILGFSELGVMRGKDQPKLAAMFGDIHTSGGRMLALVNDLLDVSKIESTIGAITLERLDLRSVVEQVLLEFRPQLAARQLHLAIDLGPGALVAKADPVRFAQVVRNVVANAIKFSPIGSAIEVKGRLLVDEHEVRISVRDHGVGIPEKELERIFEAFVQSSTTKDGSGGTGLGLAICKKIMSAHGGRIVASNVRDGGAEFHVFLPARVHLDRETTY